MTIPPLTNPEVIDLAFSCFSPDLIKDFQIFRANQPVQNCHIRLDRQRLEWLLRLDRDPQALKEHLSSLTSRRLGLYHEALWHFFIASDERLELVARNLPVRDHHRTLGEFDIIYLDRELNQHFHLELAVKFYLGTSCQSKPALPGKLHLWLGRNGDDRLDFKLYNLIKKQTQITSSEAGKKAWKIAIQENQPPIREISMKGMLFRPQYELTFDERLSKQVIRGSWLNWQHLVNNLDQEDAKRRWVMLDKKDWLHPAQFSLDENVLDKSALRTKLADYFHAKKMPVMVCGLSPINGKLVETDRSFVTPVKWPDHQPPE